MNQSQMLKIGAIIILLALLFLGFGYRTNLVGQATSVLIPESPCTRGDLTGDRTLDAADLKQWLSLLDDPAANELTSCCVDLDNQPGVTQSDYDIFFDAFVEGKTLGTC